MRCDNCRNPVDVSGFIQTVGSFDQPMFFCDEKCFKKFYKEDKEDKEERSVYDINSRIGD